MYSSFLPKYNTRIAIPCDYEAAIYGHNPTGLDYNVSVVIDLKNGTPPSSLKAHLALTESEIPEVWGMLTEVNYVCRAMYPTHNGTVVNFAGGDQVVINYTFTLDPSWLTQHVELVAFMQDDATQEILQGTMVPIENLIPLAADANFSCNDTMPCINTTVDFYDESLGIITSWNWTFEGGTPATSTAQNPSVSYSVPGVYDVQLIVDDGTVIDTLLMTDYVEAITTPAQANTPSGPADLCSGSSGYTYTTYSVTNATDYTWALDPASAGTITGNGISASVDVDPAYTGSLDVKVRADNQCGDGVWSEAFNTTVFNTPSAFWISDGAGYCEGSQGIEVTMDGSETGVDYDLLLDGVSTGNVLAGTGSALNFGYQTDEGIYTVQAFTSTCDNMMMGNAYIYQMDIPGQAAMPSGDDLVCPGEEADYMTNGASDAETYVWTLSPAEAGTISGTTVDATVQWSASYSGQANITVQGINDCGDGVVSDAFEVMVDEIPTPEIMGNEYVMQNSTHNYSTEDHAGATYAWTVTGGTIDAGQGSHEITVTWGGPGTGYINLTETSAATCDGIATEKIINIDPVGIEESFINEISLYPNPAGERLNVELYSEKDSKITLHLISQLGQTVIKRAENLKTGDNNFSINTSDLQNGIYTLKIVSDEGIVVQEKFIVMK
jgi:PKD repeat protein